MQGNPNPIVPHEAGKATRFRPGYDPKRKHEGWSNRRLSTKFICKRLDTCSLDGRTANDDILEHLIEVATKWEVVVVGKDSSGEPIKVASARDSVDAAKLLWSYALGKPPSAPEESRLALAEHFRKVEDQRFGYAMQLLGERVRAMSDAERAAFFNSLVVDKHSFVHAAEREREPAQEQAEDGQPTESRGAVSAAEAAGANDGNESTP